MTIRYDKFPHRKSEENEKELHDALNSKAALMVELEMNKQALDNLAKKLTETEKKIDNLKEINKTLSLSCVDKNIEIMRLNTMIKNIIHCEECGSSWYSDGFTSSCPTCKISALKRQLEEKPKKEWRFLTNFHKNELPLYNNVIHLWEKHVSNTPRFLIRGYAVDNNDNPIKDYMSLWVTSNAEKGSQSLTNFWNFFFSIKKEQERN